MIVKPLFFLRAFNDIDHLTGLIDRFSEKGHEVHVILFSEFMDYDNDYRIQYLKNKTNIVFHNLIDPTFGILSGSKKLSFTERIYKKIILRARKRDFIGKVIHKLFFNRTEEYNFLIKNNITQCIFEWGEPGSRGESQRKFFEVARSLGIKTFCLPHGCNIYTSPCVTDYQVKLASKGKFNSLKKYSDYDYLVLQNRTRRDQFVSLGCNSNKTQYWGSVRFDPNWQKKNLELCPKFTSTNNCKDKVKVVFMHHQFKYRLHEEKIWKLLNNLIELDWVYLIIKDSTREGLTLSSDEFYKKIENYKNVERVGNNVHSPALIQWSDCVINFGSSIAIESILQGKTLITASYLHENETLFERYPEASCLASSSESIINTLERIKNNENTIELEYKNNPVINEVVYGGKGHHDVIDFYYKTITDFHLNY